MTTPRAVIEVRLATSAGGAADLDRVVGLPADLATDEPTVDRGARTIRIAVTDDLTALAEIAGNGSRRATSRSRRRVLPAASNASAPPRPIGGPGRPIKRNGPRPGARRPEAAALGGLARTLSSVRPGRRDRPRGAGRTRASRGGRRARTPAMPIPASSGGPAAALGPGHGPRPSIDRR